jgi:predicted RNA polymerase sigma factor
MEHRHFLISRITLSALHLFGQYHLARLRITADTLTAAYNFEEAEEVLKRAVGRALNNWSTPGEL